MSIGALYICYLPLDEPLVHTQVLPYLRGLADVGHRIHLLTFGPRPPDRTMRSALRAQGVWWHNARYHRRPRLIATALDVLVGLVVATAICVRYRLKLVHARSHVPAAMGVVLQALLRRHLIFDLRGLMAEEYADAGVWRVGSIGYRMTKAVERTALRRADGVVVLTESLRQRLTVDTGRTDIVMIPCCANVESVTDWCDRRAEAREQLGVGDRPVLLYLGKFGGWYMDRETVDFFLEARCVLEGLFFLVLTQSDHAAITRVFVDRGVEPDDFRVMCVEPSSVGAAIAAADLGIALIRPVPSKVASSPTKVGEYLAGGLPVVVTAGIGDLDDLVRSTHTGVLVDDASADGLMRAAKEVAGLVADPATAARCRATATARLSMREIGIPRYRALYASLVTRG